MIENRYALKYSMPHSLVHIVDNSQYTGPLPTVVADDPSLLATIVVTAAPMGEDNKMIAVNRSDVLGVAYGMNSLSVDDIKKYGQSVTYPSSLISQGAPVRLMRVTPEGSSYAVAAMVVQWRIDGTDNKLHVRFKVKEWPEELQREKFKNTDRVNEALIKSLKFDDVDRDAGGTWYQRAFINFISAGRGTAYNNMVPAINMTSQSRRPSNVKYEFDTIDTTSNQVVEKFAAALINTNNGDRVDAIDSVNTAVAKRLQGSSIVVPYVNEAAVRELYKVYMDHYKNMLDTTEVDNYVSNVYKTMNINIFDVIFGNYIHNGTDTSAKLPFYQVDMLDTDIPGLDEDRLVYTINDNDAWDEKDPQVLYNKILGSTYGVTRTGDSVYVGDLYLSPTGTGNSNPRVSVVTAINQYTGSVTVMTIPKLYPLNSESTGGYPAWTTLDIKEGVKTSKSVKYLIEDFTSDKQSSKTVDKLVAQNAIVNGDIVAGYIHGSNNEILPGFDVYTVEVISDDIGKRAVLHVVDHSLFYEMLDRTSHSGGISGTGNAFGFWYSSASDNAWDRIGAGVVVNDGTTNTIYVNDHDRKAGDPDTGEGSHRLLIANAAVDGKIGPVPTSVNLTEDLMGSQFDVLVYKNANIDSWKVTGLDVANGGTGYAVGDQLSVLVAGSSDEPTELTAEQNAYNTWKLSNPFQYILLASEPADWSEHPANKYFTKAVGADVYTPVDWSTSPAFATETYYELEDEDARYARFDTIYQTWDDSKKALYPATTVTTTCHTLVTVSGVDANGAITSFVFSKNTAYESTAVTVLSVLTGEAITSAAVSGTGSGATFTLTDFKVVDESTSPDEIKRYTITGSAGSIFAVQLNPIVIPNNYYSESYGINPTSEVADIKLSGGSTGFFDDEDISEVEFKYRFSALLVKAFRGEIDPRIQSPTRCPAKFLFDAGYNTIVGSTILPYLSYTPADLINASIIFSDDDKDEILYNPDSIADLRYEDIDVKQAMYDLMIYRCYQGIPEDKRPVGPGSGLSLHLDSGVTDANTSSLVNTSFSKRFDNPNASWDIGGWVDTETGIAFTWTKRLVDDMFRHIKATTINKPYTGKYSALAPNKYVSFFPDVDPTDWELRELLYKSGGNAWIMDSDGYLTRRSQVTLMRGAETSDLLQESNMRTLSQLCYLLQNKIDSYLLEYNDDAVIKTLSDEVNNMFSNWIGNLVDDLQIIFYRDINTDGGEILVCEVNVTFRGLVLRVPIIVNVNRRENV